MKLLRKFLNEYVTRNLLRASQTEECLTIAVEENETNFIRIYLHSLL
jgi:hypothetical protein